MKYHTSLSDHIQTKKHSRVLSDLDNTELDMTYNEGEFFILCIRNNSYDILKALLGYFEENQLSVYKSSSHEYHVLKNKMRDILEMAIEDVELSLEMKQVLSPYLNFEDEVDSGLQEFSKEENSDYQLWISSLETNSDVLKNPTLESTGETELSGDLVQDHPDLL